MNIDLQVCPGNSLPSFLKAVAYDLKRRQIEYLITAYFDENGLPRAMRQITGRTSWITSSINDIIEEAKGINASGVCLVHNHPAKGGEKPNLTPSDEDITYQRQFLEACQKNNLAYLGCWIVSKGHFTETLYHMWQVALKKEEGPLAQDIYVALTPTLKETVEALTKPLVVVLDQYDIDYISGNNNRRLAVQSRNVYPLGNPEANAYQLLLTIREVAEVSPLERFNVKLATGQEVGEYKNVAEFSDVLSFEETSRACDAIQEVYEEAVRLSFSTVKYKEVNLKLSDNSACGFFQKEATQTAFITIKGEHIFLAVNDFQELHHLFEKAIDQLESLSMPQAEAKTVTPESPAESAKNIRVSIKGPDDSKKLYLIAKEFYKDAGVTFDKAKEFLTKGVIMSFEDRNNAMKFIEKYNQMGCRTELKEAKGSE
jgi:hypothetical protein